jgi:hypothetical protein
MGRHVLTPEEQLRGIRAAVASPRTPPQLRSALKDRMEILQGQNKSTAAPQRSSPKEAKAQSGA